MFYNDHFDVKHYQFVYLSFSPTRIFFLHRLTKRLNFQHGSRKCYVVQLNKGCTGMLWNQNEFLLFFLFFLFFFLLGMAVLKTCLTPFCWVIKLVPPLSGPTQRLPPHWLQSTTKPIPHTHTFESSPTPLQGIITMTPF